MELTLLQLLTVVTSEECITGVRKYRLLYDTTIYVFSLQENFQTHGMNSYGNGRKINMLMYVHMSHHVTVKFMKEPELILCYFMSVL